jgi:hypothetical protein
MSEKVRRIGIMAVAAVAGVGLIRISSSSAFALPSATPILKSKVSPPLPGPTPNPMPEPLPGVSTSTVSLVRLPLTPNEAVPSRAPAGVWAVPIASPSSDNASALVSRRAAQSRRAGVGRVVGVTMKVGRAHPMAYLTNAPTVGDLIAVLGLRVNATDRLAPGPAQSPTQGGQVRIVRIRRVVQTVLEPVPFTSVIQYSKSMVAGTSFVQRAGVPGRQVSVYRVTYRNGRVAKRELISRRQIDPAVSQLLVEGAPAPQSGVEIGTATWYACEGMHAAHLSLPFGTSVTVTDLDNGNSVTVVINDRGPFAPGTDKIIDLCSPAFSLLAPLSQGTASVRITW